MAIVPESNVAVTLPAVNPPTLPGRATLVICCPSSALAVSASTLKLATLPGPSTSNDTEPAVAAPVPSCVCPAPAFASITVVPWTENEPPLLTRKPAVPPVTSGAGPSIARLTTPLTPADASKLPPIVTSAKGEVSRSSPLAKILSTPPRASLWVRSVTLPSISIRPPSNAPNSIELDAVRSTFREDRRSIEPLVSPDATRNISPVALPTRSLLRSVLPNSIEPVAPPCGSPKVEPETLRPALKMMRPSCWLAPTAGA